MNAKLWCVPQAYMEYLLYVWLSWVVQGMPSCGRERVSGLKPSWDPLGYHHSSTDKSAPITSLHFPSAREGFITAGSRMAQGMA